MKCSMFSLPRLSVSGSSPRSVVKWPLTQRYSRSNMASEISDVRHGVCFTHASRLHLSGWVKRSSSSEPCIRSIPCFAQEGVVGRQDKFPPLTWSKLPCSKGNGLGKSSPRPVPACGALFGAV